MNVKYNGKVNKIVQKNYHLYYLFAINFSKCNLVVNDWDYQCMNNFEKTLGADAIMPPCHQNVIYEHQCTIIAVISVILF